MFTSNQYAFSTRHVCGYHSPKSSNIIATGESFPWLYWNIWGNKCSKSYEWKFCKHTW